MGAHVRGVVARAKGAPVTLETIVVPDPVPARRWCAVQACGVCHTDLHYREGGINDDFPFLLGHEAAGVVESVGADVSSVAPGDFVVLNWRAVCGECRSCRRGRPWYCFATHNATQKMTLADGTPLSPALGIGAFADKTLVAAGQCTKVDPAARPEAVGLLGCGVMAGLGAAMFTGQRRVGRLGRRLRLRRCRVRRRRGVEARRGGGHHRRRPRPAQAHGRNGSRRDAHGRRQRRRSGRGDPGDDGRQRRRRLHRGRRPPGRDRAGLHGARPGRHPRTGRRADSGHAHRPAHDRVLRAGAARSSRAGTATASPPATSPCSSTTTWPGGSISTPS